MLIGMDRRRDGVWWQMDEKTKANRTEWVYPV